MRLWGEGVGFRFEVHGVGTSPDLISTCTTDMAGGGVRDFGILGLKLEGLSANRIEGRFGIDLGLPVQDRRVTVVDSEKDLVKDLVDDGRDYR